MSIGGGVAFDALDCGDGQYEDDEDSGEEGDTFNGEGSVYSLSDDEYAPSEDDIDFDEEINGSASGRQRSDKSTKAYIDQWLNRYRLDSQLTPIYRYALPGRLGDIEVTRHEHFVLTSTQSTQVHQLKILREVLSAPTLLHLLHFYTGTQLPIESDSSRVVPGIGVLAPGSKEWSMAVVVMRLLMTLLSSDEAVHASAPSASSDANTTSLTKQQQLKLQQKKVRDVQKHDENRTVWAAHLQELEVLLPSLVSQLLTFQSFSTFLSREDVDEETIGYQETDQDGDNDVDADDDAADEIEVVSFDKSGTFKEIDIDDTVVTSVNRMNVSMKVSNDTGDVNTVGDEKEISSEDGKVEEVDSDETDCVLKEDSKVALMFPAHLSLVNVRRNSKTNSPALEPKLEAEASTAPPLLANTTSSTKMAESGPTENDGSSSKRAGARLAMKTEFSFLPFPSSFHFGDTDADTKENTDDVMDEVDTLLSIEAMLQRLQTLHMYSHTFEESMKFASLKVSGESQKSLVLNSVESLIDLLLGRPGSLRLHGTFLLTDSWDLTSSIEPTYKRYHTKTPVLASMVKALKTVEDDIRIPGISLAEAKILTEKRISLSKAIKSEENKQDILTGMMSTMSISLALPLLLRTALEASILSSPGAICHLGKLYHAATDSADYPRNDLPEIDTEARDRAQSEDANMSASTALTIMCLIYSLLDQSLHFRKSLFTPVLPKSEPEVTSKAKRVPTKSSPEEQTIPPGKSPSNAPPVLLIDQLLSYIMKIFQAAGQAKLVDILGPEIDLIKAFNAFDNGVQLPYHVIYSCCASPIGRMCLQIFNLLFSSDKFRMKPSRLRDVAIANISRGGEVLASHSTKSTATPTSKKSASQQSENLKRQNSGASSSSSSSTTSSAGGVRQAEGKGAHNFTNTEPKLIALTDLTVGERSYLHDALIHSLSQGTSISAKGSTAPPGVSMFHTAVIPALPYSIATTFLYVFNAAFRRRVIDVLHYQQVCEMDMTLRALSTRPATPPRHTSTPPTSRRSSLSTTPTTPQGTMQSDSRRPTSVNRRSSMSSLDEAESPIQPTSSTTTYYFQPPSASNSEFLEISTHYVTSDTRLKRKLFSRQFFPTLAPFLAQVLYFELELTSLTTGSFEAYLQPRVLQPLGNLIEIVKQITSDTSATNVFASSPTPLSGAVTVQPKLPTLHVSKNSTVPSDESLRGKGGDQKSAPKKSGGWGSSLSYFLGGSTTTKKAVVEDPQTPSARKDECNSDNEGMATSTTAAVLFGSDRTISSEEEVGDVTIKPLYTYRLGQIKKNLSTLVAQTFTGSSNASTLSAERIANEEKRLAGLERHESVVSLTNAMRRAAVLLLETLREKNTKRKEVLLFMFHHKDIFFCRLPEMSMDLKAPLDNTANDSRAITREDSEYAATLSFYFYQCLYDDDLELRIRALLCWGHLMSVDKNSSENSLAFHARELLIVQVRYGLLVVFEVDFSPSIYCRVFIQVGGDGDSTGHPGTPANSPPLGVQMKIDLWQHGLGGMCLLEELLMLLVQYGYDAETSSSNATHTSSSDMNTPGKNYNKSSRRSSLGSSRSEAVTLAASDRRPDMRLTQPLEQKSISYQQKLQQQQQDDGHGSSELPPGSLLKQQSVLVQNHVLSLVKRFMKWLDELDECVQEGLEVAISSTADRMRVGMIEEYRKFLKGFHKEVARLNRLSDMSFLFSPTGRYSISHMGFVLERHSSQKRYGKALQKKYLQVLLYFV